MRNVLLLIIALSWALANAQAGTTAQDKEDTDTEASEQVLDPVEVTRNQGPTTRPTGSLLFRPILLSSSRSGEAQATEVLFTFNTILEQDNHRVEPPFGESERFVFSFRIPDPVSDRKDQAYRLEQYGLQSISLPVGSYVLSEVIYKVPAQLSARPNRGDRLGLTLLSGPPDEFRYCMSERALSFDITEDEQGYIGALLLNDVPETPRYRRRHKPLEALDTSMDSLPTDDDLASGGIVALPSKPVQFADVAGLCQPGPGQTYRGQGW